MSHLNDKDNKHCCVWLKPEPALPRTSETLCLLKLDFIDKIFRNCNEIFENWCVIVCQQGEDLYAAGWETNSEL